MKEYEVISCSSELSARKMARTATQELNDHMKDGWEVHTITATLNAINIVFVRERSKDAPPRASHRDAEDRDEIG